MAGPNEAQASESYQSKGRLLRRLNNYPCAPEAPTLPNRTSEPAPCRTHRDGPKRVGISLADRQLQKLARQKVESKSSVAQASQLGGSSFALPHGFGCGPVYSEQQTGPPTPNSITSARVQSGSYKVSCHFPSRPSIGGSANFTPLASNCLAVA